MKFFTVLVAFSPLSALAARTFTVTNKCPYTVWPAIFTDLNVGSAKPDAPTGWEAPSGSSKTFNVPENWTAGRLWGRRACDFSNNNGPTACLDGGCNGGLECDPHTGTGVPPVTLAEFSLSAGDGNDNYDVSNVDGFNIPLRIDNNKGCPVGDCPIDLNANCPGPLRGPTDSSGALVGCKSACIANLDGKPQDSANCCSGSHNTPQTCPSSGVQFYDHFHNNCPNAYAYAYDDKIGLKHCPKEKKADYDIIFCPDHDYKQSKLAGGRSQIIMTKDPGEDDTSVSGGRGVHLICKEMD